MKIKNTAFSFEESLRFLEKDMAPQQVDGKQIGVCDTLTVEDLYPQRVTSVNSTIMYVKITYKGELSVKHKEYAYHAAMNLILKIVQSVKTLRLLNIQADGSLMAVYDTPMKKQIEEVINLSAQVRSINEVVLLKLNQNLANQIVTVGLHYGTIVTYNTEAPLEEMFFAGEGMTFAKQLTELREDCILISEGIYINLSEEMQKNLFENQSSVNGEKYYYAPLINIGMHKWVEEQLSK